MKQDELIEIITNGENSGIEFKLDDIRPVRNHIIVEVLRDYGYVDARGMGVRTKVVPALKVDDARSLFDATDDYMKVVVGKASVKPPESVVKVSVKAAESVGKTSGKILAAINDNDNITIPELADLAGVTQRSVERHLRKLKQKGILKRVGGRKHGYWEVSER